MLSATLGSRSILQCLAADRELPLFAQRIEAPRTGAGEGEVKEHEAEQDREIAAVENGQEASWRMSEKIGKRHLPGENECHGTGEQANIIRAPPTSSSVPARPSCENSVTSLNVGTAGNFGSFAIPYCRNSSPVMMRITLKT